MANDIITNDLLLNKTEDVKLSRDASSEKLRSISSTMRQLKTAVPPNLRSIFSDLYAELQKIIRDTEYVKQSFDLLYSECINKPQHVDRLRPESRVSVLNNLEVMERFSAAIALCINNLETDVLMLVSDCLDADKGR